MKKILGAVAVILVSAIVFCGKASAADRGYARAGIMAGFTSSSANPRYWDANSTGRFHVGFSAQLPLAFGFSVQPSILYQSKGTNMDWEQTDGTLQKMNLKTGYVEIPVQLQWGKDLVALRPYVFAEPFVGYGLHTCAKSTTAGVSAKTTAFNKAGLARWEYGVSLGAGIDIWKVQASVKYYWNFGSLYNENGKMNNIGHQVKDAFKDGRNFNGVTISVAYFF